ncbi:MULTISPECIES: ABC transporter permease [Congzhengia]|uniref:ABC transporter permease n=1 Tax=Congzhengia minquanensis TaxID=2763657 RepID=A0A926DM35_9FIRM|nr:ABC transporter permease [Congzhengia minquanensis]MBC8541480.1 ABC transporter permease [Congzhengia minquanensis]MBD8947378.1 ABC transporter permease [Clostridiales bacterium]HBL81594.1 ABC transporter permease [Clostridiales bacterium]
MFIQIIGSLQLGLLYAAMAMGVFVTFRILDIADLTVDGSFVTGMATAAVVTIAANNPVLGILAGTAAGGLAGLITGLLLTKVKVPPILAGIITMTGLYSINMFIMGEKSNLSLVGQETVFTWVCKASPLNDEIDKLILSALIIAAVAAILAVFFKTRPGMAIRATGDNEEMVRSSSINADVSKCLGIVIANACVGLSGSLICQYQMFSDVGYGTGMVVIGLASIIIGESICGRRGVGVGILSACVGSAVYRIIIALALRFEIFPSYALKLISAVIVALSIAIPTAKKAIGNARMKSQRRNVQ